MKDFVFAFCWWLMLLGLGGVLFPLGLSLFGDFWDKGWIFTKSLAILLLSYLVFTGGVLHWLPFSREGILLVVLFLALVNFFLFQKSRKKREKTKWWRVGISELVFTLAFFFWVWIRGFQPEIRGLEKFMDFGFVNSILRSRWFPPQDMWFAGKPINYYYFGHFQSAVLIKLLGIKPAVGYNLALATIFAFVFGGSFSLVSNWFFLGEKRARKIKREILVAGLISSLLLCLGGNFHPPIYVLKEGVKKYWYPDATRFIGYHPNNPQDKTIHEFPAYSFVVADLHGHLNNLPTVILFLAFLTLFAFEKKRRRLWGWLGFLLAVMYMSNSWDFPIYGALYALVSGLLFNQEKKGRFWRQWLIEGSKVLLVAIVFTLPFSLYFKPMGKGIGLVHAHSLWWQLLVLWGFFWVVTVSFWWWWKRQKRASFLPSDWLVLGMTVWATGLIFIPEVVYLKDIYIAEYHRANTMFKLVYQAFVLYALSAGYIVLRLKRKTKGKEKFLFLLLFFLGFSGQMIYPFLAIKGYYGPLRTSRWQGLDGESFLSRYYPDDYQGIKWLRENLSGQPVVLEAPGDSYTDSGRVSVFTGFPTVQGWIVHEWLWRGDYSFPHQRTEDVDAIYRTDNLSLAREQLKKYHVQYIFVGEMERRRYPHLEEKDFSLLGEEVFSFGKTKIYRVFK